MLLGIRPGRNGVPALHCDVQPLISRVKAPELKDYHDRTHTRIAKNQAA
jgi:hypothetical protein